jgi:hypothetical protein
MRVKMKPGSCTYHPRDGMGLKVAAMKDGDRTMGG